MKKHAIGAMSRTIVELFATQGAFAILFGLVALLWPGTTLTVFALMCGIFAITWGVILIAQSILGMGKLSMWWVELLFGIAGVIFGIYLLQHPGLTTSWMLVALGIAFVVRGIVDFSQAMFSREYLVRQNPWLYAINSVFALIAGIVLILFPATSGLAFVWVAGVYAILAGIILITMAYKFQKSIDR